MTFHSVGNFIIPTDSHIFQRGSNLSVAILAQAATTKTFGSTRALAMHFAREHGYRKKVRYFAVGDTCHVCLQLFHSRTRLGIHYEKNEKCYATVRACWPPMPQAVVEELDLADKAAETCLRKDGWWASKALSPALQLYGPALPPALSHDATAMWHKMQTKRPSDVLACENMHGRRVNSKPATVARETSILHVRALVIVHFFSGFRREGDIHDIIGQRVAISGEHIFTLSVDLCMKRQHADLAKPGALPWWQARAASGQIVCAGGGPPCDTYTAARYHALEDGTGPRPLRSASDPTGLPGLSRREQLQVWIGDCLLRFLIDLLSILAAMGMAGFLEHPQYPTWCRHLSPASIWTMDAIRLLKGLQCFAVVSFDQCTCGALGKKPTTLLLLRLPQVRSRLLQQGLQGRCQHLPGVHDALIGKQSDGTY